VRIAQIVLPGASEYERKSQRIDRASLLAAGHEVTTESGDVAHVYAPLDPPAALFKGIHVPYLANAAPRVGRFTLAKPRMPERIVLPPELPEAVEDEYFAEHTRTPGDRRRIGSFGPARPSVQRTIELTQHRIHRFREDIDWLVFERPPTPGELGELDAWVDPSPEESDLDGFVAEALASGLAVVAVRTAINLHRTEKGRTAFLTPHDPNELTHAILAALFKPEAHRPRIDAARQTISKFRARQRYRVLAPMYETLRK
jgi:hypothetical protein